VSEPKQRSRALDVGAGIGRVTSDVLLHLVSDVVILEPVESFIREAYALGRSSADLHPEENPGKNHVRWKGIHDKSKGVTFLQGTLQSFDPSAPLQTSKLIGFVGHEPAGDDQISGFDVIWCQWCLGHLNDEDLVAFLGRSKRALRASSTSVIMVKENLCADLNGGPNTIFDPEDSSLTR
jgi:protein N-terminal methyltransferase